MEVVVESDARRDLVDANHILVDQGVLDAFGHVSVRDPHDSDAFLISRNLAPGLVTVDDIQKVALSGETDDPRPSYLERYIHAEIYRARPHVQAVVHSHAAETVPFSISSVPLQPVVHMAGFLRAQTPVFEIRDCAGAESDLLISNTSLGVELANVLGDAAVALMRGHGFVAVGNSIPQAVARSVYTSVNAKAQATAIQLGGSYAVLTAGEAESTATTNDGQVLRAWNVWRTDVCRTRQAQSAGAAT